MADNLSNTLSREEIAAFAKNYANSESQMHIWHHILTNGLVACAEREIPQGKGWEVIGTAKLVSSGRCDVDALVPLPPIHIPDFIRCGQAIAPVLY